MPTDIQKFITGARPAYAAAGKEPYADTLAPCGCDAAKLNEAKVGLDVLSNAEMEYSARSGETTRATKKRDEAPAALMEWFTKFRKIARLALKKESGLREKLKL